MANDRIADHGLLADGCSAALVDRDGSVNWWCPDRFDAPSVFARLLDPDGGHWSLRPPGRFEVHRSYLPGTLVLRTVFRTGQGEVAVTDGLALEPGARGHEIGLRSPRALVRVVEGISGVVPMTMSYRPRFEYARRDAYLVADDGALRATAGPATLTLSSTRPLAPDTDQATVDFEVRAGERQVFTLGYAPTYGQAPAGPDPHHPDPLAETVRAWRSWAEEHPFHGDYADLVQRNALVLQGLTYQPSGAVVAAATTSLPEELGGDRNYDYRYAWLRDFCLTLRALWVAACPTEAGRLFDWVASAVGRVGGSRVPVMFGVEGERDLDEQTMETLRGYAGTGPVRVGNAAWRQWQLDVPGEVLDAAWRLRDRLDPMPGEIRDLLRDLADQAATNWRAPDAGMWEARDAQRHYLSSKVYCWVALDRAVRFGDRLGDDTDLARWARQRDEAREAILRKGWNPDVGAFTGAFESDRLDASVLLMPIIGFLPAADPRMRATINVIDKRLSHGGLVRRWDGDPATFHLCSFWLVQCLALAGERDRARHLFDTVVSRANDLGLFAEQLDAQTGEQLGNFPQAFSHIGLILAAWQLSTGSAGATSSEEGFP